MGELISHTSWMRDVPDNTPVTTLSIPGTHNSGCVGGPFGLGKTQNLDLSDQLDAGIRFLDIRLAQYQDNLFVHHDVVCMGKSYTDVLTICSRFLTKHPSEAIFMSVMDEGRIDGALGKFAPSEILGRLSMGNIANEERNTCSFADTLKEKTCKDIENAELFYNFAAYLPSGDSATTGCALMPETTLHEIRGKVVLLRRFEGGQDAGLDLTYWPENQTFRSARTFRSAESPTCHVHDRYRGLADAHIEEAKRGDPKDLYITFSSAVDLRASGYAKTINPRLNDYLAKSPNGRVGITAMDYFEEPRELVSNVIKMN
jgi:1-phosphatidylinositol phosphodiesterase